MFIHTAPRTFVQVPGGCGRLGSRAVVVWEAAEPGVGSVGTMVASIIMYSLSQSLLSSWKIRSKTPLFAPSPETLMDRFPGAETLR
jgi:hypothetical protein